MARAVDGRPQDERLSRVQGETLITPVEALGLARFFHDGAVLGLWGAFAYLAVLVPRDLALTVAARLATARVAAVGLAVATTVLALPLEAATIGDGWDTALNPTTLHAVLFETSVGRALQVQAVAALLLLGTHLIPVRLQGAATAAAAGLALLALTFSGHAAMHEGWLGLAQRINDGLHLLAGGAWVGALLPLLFILRALDDPQREREAGVALRRFSTAGHCAVALVIATGLLNTIFILGGWPLDWSFAYQALLSAKIAVVGLMTLLALLNRYVLVPRLVGGSPSALPLIRLITLVEVGLGAAVIGLVAAFGLLEPN